MASASTLTTEEVKRSSRALDIFGDPAGPVLLELSRILLSCCFLRHLFDFGRFDLLIQNRPGPEGNLL